MNEDVKGKTLFDKAFEENKVLQDIVLDVNIIHLEKNEEDTLKVHCLTNYGQDIDKSEKAVDNEEA